MEARCPTHPDTPALGSCQRCGAFFCAADRVNVDGAAYCATCGVRPDVDWILGYRNGLLGKRDGWAWYFLIQSIGLIGLGANIVAVSEGPSRLLGIPAAFSAIAGILFFLGHRRARLLLAITTALWIAVQAVLFQWLALLSGGFAIAFLWSAFTSTRNRLFFRDEVSREKLKRDYDRLANNLLARNAFALGFFSLLIPPVAPIAIVCGAIANARVNPNAKPPVGKRAYAIAGIVLGVCGAGMGAFWLYLMVAARI